MDNPVLNAVLDPVNDAWERRQKRLQAEEGRYKWGGSVGGADSDIARYQQLAGEATRRPGASIDQGWSNQARGEQTYALGQTRDAMGLARSAAMGNAPSAAEIYGGRMIDDSINSQMAMAASARGGPSSIAAAGRQAAFQGAQMQQAGARDLAALRAQEMAQARDQYMGSANAYAGQAGAMRGQDLGAATSQAGFDNANFDRNQQGEQFYEGMGWNTRKQEQDAALTRARDEAMARAAEEQNRQSRRRDDWGMMKDVASGVASLAGGAAGTISDIRAKEQVAPIQPSPVGGIVGVFADGLKGFGGGGSSAYMPRIVGSDERMKTGAASPSAYVLAPGQGVNVLETIKTQSRAPARMFRQNGGMSVSDEEAKYIVGGGGEDPMASANRAQEGSAYIYKPGFDEMSGQSRGEMNVGPMAQTMASDPIAGTAVKQDKKSGLLYLDNDKLQKVQSAGIASLQRQLDALKGGR